MRLEPMGRLPPSIEALAEDAEDGTYVPPVDRPLPWTHFGRGRGWLVGVALLGLVAFLLPWVEMQSPHLESLSGFALARGGAPWLWGGAVGWFVLIPLVMSRRSVRQMRGVRIVCALFAAMTLAEVAMLVALPPQTQRPVAFVYEWGLGLLISAVASGAGIVAALRLGGRDDDLPGLDWTDAGGHPQRESSRGETLH